MNRCRRPPPASSPFWDVEQSLPLERRALLRAPLDIEAGAGAVTRDADDAASHALIALLDSSWADSAAGKRRERQIYFYRAATDTSSIPQIHTSWNDSVNKPPTPCRSWVRRNNPGPDWVLTGYAHAHPFTPLETQPTECGPPWAGNPYTQQPSTFDNNGQASLGVPGYAIDKEKVNKYARKPKYMSKLYPWNTSACTW